MQFKQCLLALQLIPGVGPVTLRRWLAQLQGNLADIFTNPELIVANESDKRQTTILKYLTNPAWGAVERALRWGDDPQNHIITLRDAEYPKNLLNAPAISPILFVKGDLTALHKPSIAMVGSRHPTYMGKDIAKKFAQTLTAADLAIISGLAIGIDEASHRGCLAGGGITIAVLGNGVDRIYPATQIRLAEEIAMHGALISEFPLGTTPLKSNFPQRNRLISALALGTVVVEATLESGSLITAQYAKEQRKPVFAVPGSINNPQSKGCHALIRQGALLVEDAKEILAQIKLNLVSQDEVLHGVHPKINEAALDEKQHNLLKCIGYESTSIDNIVLKSMVAAEHVYQALLELEILGLISAVPGGYVRQINGQEL